VKRSAVIVGVGIFLLIGVVSGGLFVTKKRMFEAAANAPAFEPAEAVTLANASSTPWQPTSDLVGTVFSLRSITVQNEVEGVIRFVGFQSGDVVEPGQILVKLDDAAETAELHSAEASLRVAEAEVAVAEARIKLAQSEFSKQESANRSGATTAIEMDRVKAELERTTAELIRAKAGVDEAKARVEQVKTRLDKHVIRAPFRARVGLRTVHEGQFLAQQMGGDGTAIATLQEVADQIYIDFAIPQEQINRVRVGMKVAGVKDGGGSLSDPPEPITLEVAAIDSAANNVTRNVRVRSIVDNRAGKLRPGMFIKIRVPVDEPRSFVVVPVTAIRRASYGDQVFVIKNVEEPGPDGAMVPKMRAEQRFVRLGPTIGSEIIVLEGLKEGEQIATSGSFKLREGALVMPAIAGTPAGPGAPGSAPGGPPGSQPAAAPAANAAPASANTGG
jgi:membrane fusion protein, multidrug efflux system